MNFEVPQSEKEIAEKAKDYFELLVKKTQEISDYLNLIYDPFQKYQNPDMDMISKYRKTFRQYRDQVQKRFNEFLKISQESISLIDVFRIDTATQEIIDSFISSLRELEKYIETFVSIFSNLSNQEFRNYLLSTIESLKKQLKQISQLVDDRVLEHIDNNILAKDWADNLAERFDNSSSKQVPIVMRLFKERQEALRKSR